MLSSSPSLFVVATPLGNLGDFSPRAREVLAGADIVLAEDTRRTANLLRSAGIEARLVSCHDHNEAQRIPEMLDAMRDGKKLALVSDAGTPLFSDPGYRLVRAAREAGLSVSAVPGPSAPLCALAASGIAPQPFTFLGFAPRKQSEQKTFFEAFAHAPTTLIFFERKNRLHATLKTAYDTLGPRELCVARELTKAHEEFILCRLEEYQNIPEDLLGEITVVVGPPEQEATLDAEAIQTIIADEMRLGGKPREVARRVADRAPGWSVKEIYEVMKDLRP
ncbi:16S rRNA (cytidine(1402)-2'-O)-methyltransferase [Oleidesulfovibrio sp.]|uniref:16S rRNA (cytidine(1402)-2'-O)-methyltransferase n=1 Tax=Oleidesulfovibrio sp. TaxID=2909707 RepID=UPI003A8AA6BE